MELMITNGLVPDDGVLEESPTAADHNDNNKYNTNFNRHYNGNGNENGNGNGNGEDPAPAAPTARSTLGEWMELAELGDAEAAHRVGNMYFNGLHGANQSFAAALTWFRTSAAGGNAYSQLMLGKMYENGAGLKRSYPEAYAWFTVAAIPGSAGGRGRGRGDAADADADADADEDDAAATAAAALKALSAGSASGVRNCDKECAVLGQKRAKLIRNVIQRGAEGREAFRAKLAAFVAEKSPAGGELANVNLLVEQYLFDQAAVFRLLTAKYKAYEYHDSYHDSYHATIRTSSGQANNDNDGADDTTVKEEL